MDSSNNPSASPQTKQVETWSSFAPSRLVRRDGIFGAIDVRCEGVVDGRKKLDQPGTIDNQANPAGHAAKSFLLKAAVRLAEVARMERDSLAHQLEANLLNDGRQRGRGEHVLCETLLGRRLPLRPHENMNVLEIREAVQEQSDEDLAQETVRPDQQDFMPAKSLTGIDQEFGHSFCFRRT